MRILSFRCSPELGPGRGENGSTQKRDEENGVIMEVLLFLLFSLTFVWILLFTQFLLNISISGSSDILFALLVMSS